MITRVLATLLMDGATGGQIALPPPAPPVERRTVVNCTMNGAILGRAAQICAATSTDIQLVDSTIGEPPRSFRDVDGSFVEQYVYRINEPLTFEATYCAADIMAVRVTSLSRAPVVTRTIPVRPGCIGTEIYDYAGLLQMVVRSQTPSNRMSVRVDIVAPILPPPVPAPLPVPIMPPPPP